MALGNISVSITLDSKLKQELREARTEVQKFVTDINKQLTKIGSDVKLSGNLKKQLDGVASEAKGLGSKINKELDGANIGGNLDKQLKPATDAIKKTTDSLSKELKKVGKSTEEVGTKLSAISLPIAGAFGAAATAAIGFEDKMADIAKTTGATGFQLDSIAEGLKKISLNTRTSLSSLQDIAAIGGQLGVPKKDILDFTDAIDKLNVSLGDEFAGGAEEITNAIGVLRNNFRDIKSDKIDQDLLKIGNAVNELGAAGLATGPVVVDFAQRISGLTSTLGQGAGDVLGLSATLQELGVSAERGGSAVGRIFQLMAQNTEKFAKIAGKPLKEFEHLVNTDINEAFITVLTAVNKNAKSATQFADVLDTLGLKGVGNAEVFSKLGQNISLLREKQDLANKSLTNTNSIMDEFNKKNKTTKAQLGKLKNTFNVLAIEIGDSLLPTINSITKGLAEFAIKATKAFKQLPDPIKKFIIQIALIAAALGPVILVIGKVITLVGTLGGAFTAVLGALGSPIGLLIGSVVALGTAFIVLGKKLGLFTGLGNVVKSFFDSVKKSFDTFKQALQDSKVQQALSGLKNAFSGLLSAFKPLFDGIKSFIGNIFQPLDLAASRNAGSFISLSKAAGVLSSAFNGIAKVLKAVTPFIGALSNAVADFLKKLNIGSVISSLFNAVSKAYNVVLKPILTALAKILSGLLPAAVNFFRAALDTLRASFNALAALYERVLKPNLVALGVLLGGILLPILKQAFARLQAGIVIINQIAERVAASAKFFADLTTALGFNTKATVINSDATKESAAATAKHKQELEDYKAKIDAARESLRQLSGINITLSESIIQVAETTENVNDKQKLYNEAVAKFGENAPQTVKALNDLTLAQNRQTEALQAQKDAEAEVATFIEQVKNNTDSLSLATQKDIQDKVTQIDKLIDLAQKNGQATDTLKNLRGELVNLNNTKKEFDVKVKVEQEALKNLFPTIQNALKKVFSIDIKPNDSLIGKVKGLLGTAFKAKGGVIGYAAGGLVKDTLYASKGAFTPKGTDTVPAMLTPGELVVPRNLTSKLFSLFRSISNLPGAAKAGGFSPSQLANNLMGGSGGGITFNVANLHTTSADDARRRAGDLGYGTYGYLKSKGLI